MDFTGNMLIRADSGPLIGTGPVLRCISLAMAWTRMGGRVEFICDRLPATVTRKIHKMGFALTSIDKSGEPAAESTLINDRINDCQPEFLVIDGPRYGLSFQRRLQLAQTRLVMIDGEVLSLESSRWQSAPVMLRQSVESGNHDRFETSSKSTVITGPEFALPISCLPDNAHPDSRRIPATARRLLIISDGKMASRNIVRVLSAVEMLALTGLTVDLLLGPNSRKLPEVLNDSEFGRSIRVHGNMDRLPSLIQQADLAITDQDSVCLSLVYHGVPTISLYSQPQQPTGSCEAVLRAADDLSEMELAELIGATIRDRELRKRLSDNSLKLIDGLGAERIARRLVALQFHFRPANRGDVDFLHRWRNDPEARANCFENECVSLDEYGRWLNDRLGSRDAELLMIEDQNSNLAGSLFVDYNHRARQAEMNIHIIPSLRGRGIGTALLEWACQHVTASHREYQITARIKSGNMMSQSAFRKAGFRKVASTTVNGLVAIHYLHINPHSGMQPAVESSKHPEIIETRRKAS